MDNFHLCTLIDALTARLEALEGRLVALERQADIEFDICDTGGCLREEEVTPAPMPFVIGKVQRNKNGVDVSIARYATDEPNEPFYVTLFGQHDSDVERFLALLRAAQWPGGEK